MLFKAISILSIAVLAAAKNPNIVSPQAMTYNCGDDMKIQWSDAETGYVNIDLVDSDPNVLSFPLMIATVPAGQNEYIWKIPSELKGATGYAVRVWGSTQPAASGEGISSRFTILNNLPNAISSFTVTSPNAKAPCVAGQNCQITWDFPQTSMHPAMVDIALYRVGNPSPILNIGTVSSSQKSYTWAVPNDPSFTAGDVYLSVSGQGTPVVGPGMSNDMGGNSQAFAVSTQSSTGADQQTQAQSSTDDKKDEEKEKKDKKSTPKKNTPKKQPDSPKKISGASKNAANTIVASAGALSVALAMTLISMYL